jgi:hypothetical protein
MRPELGLRVRFGITFFKVDAGQFLVRLRIAIALGKLNIVISDRYYYCFINDELCLDAGKVTKRP